MGTSTITLHEFDYPENLPNRKANFRFIVAVRFYDVDDSFVTEHAVMPSLDTFWECAKDKGGEINYVRDKDSPRLDMNRIDEWDKLVVSVSCKKFDSIQLTVIDVNRKDAWDRVKSVLGVISQIVLSTDHVKATMALSKQHPNTNLKPESFGSTAGDIKALTLSKLAGGNDILFRGSSKITNNSIQITGQGKHGKYTAKFTVTTGTEQPDADARADRPE